MRFAIKLIRPVLAAWAVFGLSPAPAPAQPGAPPKRVLVMHWYDRDYPANTTFELQFQSALQTFAPKGIEFYSEYLETNKFPGENQSLLLADYLRQKYAGREIDVIVTRTNPPLEFLLKYRSNLFPNTPIVFASIRPVATQEMVNAGATGIVYLNTHARTVGLALRLQPETKRIVVISGTINRDKSLESIARDELRGYQDRVAITYLTDLPLEELASAVQGLPKDSVVLYVWQQARNSQGKILESRDVLAAITPVARVPIYGMTYANVGFGLLGGYVYTLEGNAAKVAEMTFRVAHGARVRDIPVERAPEVPMFDWRQLQRFGIGEDRLPPGSIIKFRELTVWQQYKWRIGGATLVFTLQALLIFALLLERRRARRTQVELQEYKEQLERLVQLRTTELVDARDQALAANRAKSIFLANMSHELRTPLNAILGFSDMVLRDANLPARHRKDLSIVGSSGEHLLGLIDDVLDMAKIETGGIIVECECLDLHRLVNDTVNMLRERAEAKNLQLLLDISSQAARFVRSDPRKLRQVLINLVGNAVKYTDQGSVVVRLQTRTSDSPNRVTLRFDVEDTGIGIAKEDQARIFDPFVQAGSKGSRKGTGLGLAISRHFVELLGGTIQVESALGMGSRFRVEVCAEATVGSEAVTGIANVEQVTGLEPGQPEYRILVVEDQKESRQLLQSLLQSTGFQVRVAEDGEQAVEAFREWRPQFIWMDLRLPAMSGLEAAKRIRELAGKQDVAIVAITASADVSQRDEVLAAGFDAFLRKPYRSMEIFECMARHLGVRYEYAATPQATPGDQPVVLDAAVISSLPAALRDELESAVVSLNPKGISLAIALISEENPSLGSVLEHLAERFEYTRIYEAIRIGKGSLTDASL